jgi:N-terminal acetyltransferase B complex non-catalytic subunit
MSSKLFSPLKQFQNGRKELFMRVIAKYRKDENWQSIFQLCKECLVDQDESGSPNFLASDWSVWEVFILAAEHIKMVNEK